MPVLPKSPEEADRTAKMITEKLRTLGVEGRRGVQIVFSSDSQRHQIRMPNGDVFPVE